MERVVSMYKVLIVDDEVLVRVGLKTTIDWESIGFTIVSEAANGEQGYENYLKYMPDVIITDVKMPKQDGLWLVDRIREQNHEAKILVLTCYDEFSYARKALKAGADDYILKSEVEDDELIKLMEGIKGKLDDMNRVRTQKDGGSTDPEELKRTVILDLINNGFRIGDEMRNTLSDINFPARDSSYVFFGLSIVYNGEQQADTQQVNHAVLNILYDQFGQNAISFLEWQQFGNYFFFLSSPNLKISDIRNIFQFAGNASGQYFNISLNAISSGIFRQPEQSDKVYGDFYENSQVLFYANPNNHLIPGMDFVKFTEPDVFELKKNYNRSFMEAVGHEDLDRMRKLLQEMKQYFERENVLPMIVKIFFSNLTGDFFSSYGSYLSDREVFEPYKTYHYRINQSGHLEDILRLVTEFSRQLIRKMQDVRANHSGLMINRALNYIRYHYAEKISLDDVAKEINMSKHYLCNAFKKETGENMSLYINKLRIEKAKQLLLESDAKIKEIYEQVGYTDQQYFSKVFKKITGKTVIEYKENSAHAPERDDNP